MPVSLNIYLEGQNPKLFHVILWIKTTPDLWLFHSNIKLTKKFGQQEHVRGPRVLERDLSAVDFVP